MGSAVVAMVVVVVEVDEVVAVAGDERRVEERVQGRIVIVGVVGVGAGVGIDVDGGGANHGRLLEISIT
jgi:hypothetical protein